jgi:hypothetical protein
MSLKTLLTVFLLLSLITACSKADKKEEVEKPKPPAAKKAKKKEALPPRVFYSSKYTNNTKWVNGIDIIEKNLFFITVDKQAPTPVNAGYRLKFAAAGDAVVKNVYRKEKEKDASIFIQVDKILDPVKDGAPNPVYLRGFAIKPSPYSQENKWRSGISLEKPGLFIFGTAKKEPTPIKIGDHLKFARTGEAVVIKLYRFEKQEKHSTIFVTVDKALDPAGDGAPNLIEVIIGD